MSSPLALNRREVLVRRRSTTNRPCPPRPWSTVRPLTTKVAPRSPWYRRRRLVDRGHRPSPSLGVGTSAGRARRTRSPQQPGPDGQSRSSGPAPRDPERSCPSWNHRKIAGCTVKLQAQAPVKTAFRFSRNAAGSLAHVRRRRRAGRTSRPRAGSASSRPHLEARVHQPPGRPGPPADRSRGSSGAAARLRRAAGQPGTTRLTSPMRQRLLRRRSSRR